MCGHGGAPAAGGAGLDKVRLPLARSPGRPPARQPARQPASIRGCSWSQKATIYTQSITEISAHTEETTVSSLTVPRQLPTEPRALSGLLLKSLADSFRWMLDAFWSTFGRPLAGLRTSFDEYLIDSGHPLAELWQAIERTLSNCT